MSNWYKKSQQEDDFDGPPDDEQVEYERNQILKKKREDWLNKVEDEELKRLEKENKPKRKFSTKPSEYAYITFDPLQLTYFINAITAGEQRTSIDYMYRGFRSTYYFKPGEYQKFLSRRLKINQDNEQRWGEQDEDRVRRATIKRLKEIIYNEKIERGEIPRDIIT